MNDKPTLFSVAKRPALALLLVGTVLALAAWRFIQPESLEAPDASAFQQRWTQGNVILLVRHMERCDRSSAPCLGAADGITARAGELAKSLGDTIARYGLATTDIYSSPLTRTAQTADLMFDHPVARQDWLYSCKDGDMLSHIRQHKAEHRNLVLVTHSECFDRLRENLHLTEGDTPEYGETLVLFDNAANSPRIAGEIETRDWAELAHQPNAG